MVWLSLIALGVVFSLRGVGDMVQRVGKQVEAVRDKVGPLGWLSAIGSYFGGCTVDVMRFIHSKVQEQKYKAAVAFIGGMAKGLHGYS
mmetsp:Transcript_5815/g.10013  ORF Transcript_5815/g.10013 Transcript_5815/m.10013 type:complete len:88 (-) Transcript_5815:74-337(-)